MTFCAAAFLGGCAQPEPEAGDTALACYAQSAALGAEQPHGFSAPVPIRVQAPARTSTGKRVVYLNRAPRSYVAGIDDAQAGSSSVLAAQDLRVASLPGFQQGEEAWSELVGCVRAQYAKFDVAVTDVRPVTPGYLEAHFGGSGRELGILDGSGGIAPIDSAACGIVEGAVVFVFSDLFGANTRSICEVGAHEIAHAFSLDHAYRCKDPMTYVQGCGDKEFQHEDAPCGESGARACICDRPSQNSVAVLSTKLGQQRSDVVPPTIQLLDPVAAPAGQGTYIQVRAHDPDAALLAIELHVVRHGVEKVSICGDALLPCTLDGELASFALPIARGDTRVWAIAEDTSGNRTASREVVVRGGVDEGDGAIALAVAPLATRYAPGGIVEVQALVLSNEPVTRAVLVWQDGDSLRHEIPLCPSMMAGRYGVSMRLGHGDDARSFHIEVEDAIGRSARSADDEVQVLAAAPL